MKTYLSYKNKIEGFKDVSETVKTVEKIAASSVHFLEQEVSNLNIYISEVESIMARLSIFYQKKDHPLLQKRKTGKKMLVILTADKGLVGGLWHGVINTFLEYHTHYQSVVIVGQKGKNYLKEEIVPTIKLFTSLSDIPQNEEIELIANYIFNEFKKEALLKVDILYPHFITLAEQQVGFISFLPFEFELTKEEEKFEGFPIFEPSKKMIFDSLLRKYIRVFFHKIIIETKLSELSARTVAMEHASAKTDMLIQKFTLEYRGKRRRFATQKQLENFASHKTI